MKELTSEEETEAPTRAQQAVTPQASQQQLFPINITALPMGGM